MQIRFAAFIAVVMYFWSTVEGTKISSLCRKWECQLGVGSGKTGESRQCSVGNVTQTNGTIGVEGCQPTGYLCDAPIAFARNETCYKYGVLKWKRGMAAGDSCTDSAQCATGSCNNTGSTKTCSGKNYTDTCSVDNECYPGLFCNSTKKCDFVAKESKACDANTRCEFGTLCMSGNCTRFGNQDTGKQFYVPGVVGGKLGDIVKPEISRLCKTFWAENTGNVTADNSKETIFECTKGRVLETGSYDRGINDVDTCVYNFTLKNGTDVHPQEVAQCGYNTDGRYYCPKRRAEAEYINANKADQTTWNSFSDLGCHSNSTIQYCRKIEDNAVISLAYRSSMRNELEVQTYYPLIAKNDKCVGDAIETTLNYYRVIDSAYGTMLTYFALVAGFFSLALLY
jgi:hypothetical protein